MLIIKTDIFYGKGDNPVMNRGMSKILCLFMCGGILCSCSPAYEYYSSPAYVESDYTREEAGIRLEDDFYGYVNFDLLWNNNIPADMYDYGGGELVQYNIDMQLEEEIIRIAESNENYLFGSDEQKIRDFYLMYLDDETRETVGIEPLMQGLQKIEEAENINDFIEACGFVYREYGCEPIVYPYVAKDIYDSSKYIVYLQQMDFINSADELLNTSGCAENMQKIIAAILEAYGKDNTNAYDIVSMLLDIAENTSDIQRMNIEDAYNKYTTQELQQLFCNVDAEAMLEAFGASKAEWVVVYDTKQAAKLNTYLTDEYLNLWKDYAICRLLYGYSEFLPTRYRECINNQTNINEHKKAVEAVNKMLSWELGNIYADKYCDSETVNAVTKLSEEIRKAYANVLNTTEQLNDTARSRLLLKLDAMKFNIGYPDDGFRSNSIIKDNLLESCISIKSGQVKDNLSLYGQTAERGEWDMTPQTVNAYYDARSNSITITAALFNEPYFNKDGDLYSNLGGLGTVIAHEMTHAFDGEGILFDEKGCYNPQWTGTEDAERIENMRKSTAQYFDSQTIMEIYAIDGELTVDENIADVGAMYVIASMTDDKEELQRIFESYAEIWATLSYDTTVVKGLSEDVHSPAEIRVNAVLQTTDKFYYAYNISENDGMYVPFEKRIRIW